MKKTIRSIVMLFAAAAIFTACTKKDDNKVAAPTYASGQGVITGTSGATFNVTGTSARFTKVADTVTVKATLPTVNGLGSEFLMAFEKPTVGTFNFTDIWSHITDPNFVTTNAAIYDYEDTNSAGTIIVHQFAAKSGTFTISYFSSTGITGTYTFVGNDYNNNGDAPKTITGTFSGNF